LAFAAQGATVVIADREDGSETLDLIKKSGGTGIFIQCDVSNVEQVNHLMETIEKNYGRLDFAINNAGIEGVNSPIDSLYHRKLAPCTQRKFDRYFFMHER